MAHINKRKCTVRPHVGFSRAKTEKAGGVTKHSAAILRAGFENMQLGLSLMRINQLAAAL